MHSLTARGDQPEPPTARTDGVVVVELLRDAGYLVGGDRHVRLQESRGDHDDDLRLIRTCQLTPVVCGDRLAQPSRQRVVGLVGCRDSYTAGWPVSLAVLALGARLPLLMQDHGSCAGCPRGRLRQRP